MEPIIPDVTHDEFTAEIERIAKGEPGWSQVPVIAVPLKRTEAGA